QQKAADAVKIGRGGQRKGPACADRVMAQVEVGQAGQDGRNRQRRGPSSPMPLFPSSRPVRAIRNEEASASTPSSPTRLLPSSSPVRQLRPGAAASAAAPAGPMSL